MIFIISEKVVLSSFTLVLQHFSLSTIFESIKEGLMAFLCLLISLHCKFLCKEDFGMDKAADVDLIVPCQSPFFCLHFFFELTSIKLLPYSTKLFAKFYDLPTVFICTLKEFEMAVIAPFFNFPSSNCSRRAYRTCCLSVGGQIFVGGFGFSHLQVVLKEWSYVILKYVQI